MAGLRFDVELPANGVEAVGHVGQPSSLPNGRRIKATTIVFDIEPE